MKTLGALFFSAAFAIAASGCTANDVEPTGDDPNAGATGDEADPVDDDPIDDDPLTGEGEGEGEIDTPPPDPDPVPDTGPEPFAAQPDTSEGLVNVSFDLEEMLEHGELDGACDAWQADPTDRRKKLLCGKWMFFYESFGTVGVPTAIFDFFGSRFPNVTGEAWSAYGMVPDPYSEEGRPLGVGEGPDLAGAPAVAYTCASCHFAQMPDGRYAVGAPNHRYEYGKQILAIALGPARVAPGFDPAEHHPDAIADIQPILDELDANSSLRWELLFDLLPLINAQDATPTMSTEIEGHYAHWLSGTQDFVMPPLPVDDGVHTISKISALWGIPSDEELADEGMNDALLAWTGSAVSLRRFIKGFAALGVSSDEWTDDAVDPLVEYIESLRAPENLTPAATSKIEAGRELFRTKDLGGGVTCLDCHDGPRGMGRRAYTFEEIGTDDAMRWWADPNLTGVACCGLEDPEDPSPLTHGIKSPRLVGLFAMERFLHNGSLPSLDQLLCTGDGRPFGNLEHAFTNIGHEYGCDSLTDAEKLDLIAYLKSL